jgi:hypothetical protein
MAELKIKEEDLTTGELAGYGVEQKLPAGPKLVKGQEAETLDKAAAVSKAMPLFSESEMGDFRSQWSKIQTASSTSRAGRSKAQTSWYLR